MLNIKINNEPETARLYIVARNVDDSLWYWGSYNDEAKAREVASQIGGIVVRKD